jgi:hypothetical protein
MRVEQMVGSWVALMAAWLAGSSAAWRVGKRAAVKAETTEYQRVAWKAEKTAAS